ncbi:MAG: Panacea domain-containing protein [Actinomycetota bacterium]
MAELDTLRADSPPGGHGYHRHMDVEYDEKKFTELLVLVAERLADDHAGGATKLNKLLYFADFTHFRRTGQPITGAAYQKLANGPAPRRLLPVRSRLIESGEIELEERDFLGYKQHRLVTKRRADVSVFSHDELTTIDDVFADLVGMNGREVSDLSHEEAGWRLTEEGETIPYEAALIPRQQPLTPTALRQAEAVAARYDVTAGD